MEPDLFVKKVLILRQGSLGDTVVALPCFHLIARSFPNAERILLSNHPVQAKAAAAADVLGGSGLVHSSMRFTLMTRDLRELWKVAHKIRQVKPDLLVYIPPLKPKAQVWKDAIYFSLICGIRRIVGILEAMESVRHLDQTTGLYEPESFRLARMVRTLGDAEPRNLKNWDLGLTDLERGRAKDALGDLVYRPLIVCGAGTKMQAKDWGQDNWRELLRRLSSQYSNYGLVMIGAKQENEASEYASSCWSSSKINLCGALTPRESAAVLERARLFLGPDSGPMHVAAAVGVPCVIPFSARGLPGVWFPIGDRNQVIYHKTHCFNCLLETCITEKRHCLLSITVDEVADRVAHVLSQSRETNGVQSTLNIR